MGAEKNYSYDVMDGFEPLDVSRRMEPRDITLSLSRNYLLLSQAARKVLCQRKYLKVYVNRNTRELMMVSSPDSGIDSVKLPSDSGKTGFSCKPIRMMIEDLCKYDADAVVIRIPGRVCFEKQNAVIFDLKKAQSRKRKTINRG